MIVSRREFFKKFLGCGMACSLSVFVNNFMAHDSNMKFVSEKFYLMGTHGKIQTFVSNAEHGKFIVKKAIDRIKNIELLLTKFSPDSDVGLINNFSDSYNSVSDDTLFVLDSAKELSEKTFGYFDMGLGNLLSGFGIDKNVPLVGNLTQLHDLQGDLLHLRGNNVKLVRKNVMLDLGGIGKGYALDEAMKIFLNAGINNVAIEFGGDVKVNAGMPSGLPWKLFFDDNILSLVGQTSSFIELHTGSFAVSGGYLKKADVFFDCHHIIDPKSLKSKNDYYVVTVSGKDGMICDALSTACYSMETEFLNRVKNLYNDYDINVYI